MNVSLGRVNFCLQAMVEKGWVKVRNFRHNPDKRRYSYLLTPKGLKEKSLVTVRFLRRKIAEHDELLAEIDRLQREVNEENRTSS